MYKYIHPINGWLVRLGKHQCLAIALVCTFLVALFDYLTGPEFSFSIFYVAPIMMAGWYSGKIPGVAITVLSSVLWLTADIASGHFYSEPWIPVWNALVRLLFFIIILSLISIIHDHLEQEEKLADTDGLTGLYNRRAFMEQIERERTRAQRYPGPFTLAYLDLDNFKCVNDSLGHHVGDTLLISVSGILSSITRTSDFAARLGGDEFAILFPELDKVSAENVLEKLQSTLLAEMSRNQWPVTFSVGAVTCIKVMESTHEMVQLADDLMYQVKKSGKNKILHIVWPE